MYSNESRFRLDFRRKFFPGEFGGALQQVAKRNCPCPIPGRMFKATLDRAQINLV